MLVLYDQKLAIRVQMKMPKVAFLIASFNRADLTLNALSAIKRASELLPLYEIKIFLLDDASTDGTPDRVRDAHPDVELIQGTGQLYWNRGMCRAYGVALQHGPWDTYVLLNDDLEIEPQVLANVLVAHNDLNRQRPTILVGSVVTQAGELIYGGFRRIGPSRPLALERVPPSSRKFEEIDTMNGNMVVIPGQAMQSLGGLNPAYHHNYGDIDLGYRARSLGVALLLYTGIVGITGKNPAEGEKLKARNLIGRARMLFGTPNGISQYVKFMWEHGLRPLIVIYAIKNFARRTRLVLFGGPIFRSKRGRSM